MMNDNLVSSYDDWMTEISNDMYLEFSKPKHLQLADTASLLIAADKYLDDNKTKLLSGLYAVAKDDPEQVRKLLTFMANQMASLEMMSIRLLEHLDELFPEDNEQPM